MSFNHNFYDEINEDSAQEILAAILKQIKLFNMTKFNYVITIIVF